MTKHQWGQSYSLAFVYTGDRRQWYALLKAGQGVAGTQEPKLAPGQLEPDGSISKLLLESTPNVEIVFPRLL